MATMNAIIDGTMTTRLPWRSMSLPAGTPTTLAMSVMGISSRPACR